MDTDNISKILPIAEKMGFLQPTSRINPCLLGCINTANLILYELKLAGEQGKSTSQLSKVTKLHHNTLKCYLRELMKLKLVDKTKERKEDAVWTIKK